MLEILKASAGSGKTFNLAKTYIGMLFRSPDRYAYRHILAVTFTNKATDEMKRRIIKELDILASEPERSGYFADFSREFGGREKLKERAGDMLVNILHDYNAFSISTIDRFFQMTLKSFAREIGQMASYQVDLDKKSLVSESVDRILDSLSEDDPEMLRWLRDCAMEQINEKGSYRLEDTLHSIADDLESERLKSVLESQGTDISVLYSRENLRNVRKLCREYRNAFTDKVVEAAERVHKVFTDCGCSEKDTNRGFLKVIPEKYLCLKRGDAVPALTAAFIDKASDPEKWFPLKNRKLLHVLDGALDGPLEDFVTLLSGGIKGFNTADIILGQLYGLGVASRLHMEYEALMKEKNVLSLDDSNSILRTIIGEDDAPFIYEKLGVRYENFLLDEFQDTSLVQWENFRPLLKESLSHAGDSRNEVTDLIVGDIKQSIYRWRGSDWDLLASRVKAEFGESADDSRALSDNWRSCRNIVGFNNDFFSYAAAVLDRTYGGGSGIPDIYGDVRQTPRKSGAAGSLEFTFCGKDHVGGKVVEAVRRAVEQGSAELGDIAVLVRGNKEGAEIASILTSSGIQVISDDSLSVKSSLAVRRLVSLMNCAGNSGDTLGSFLAGSINVECPSDYHSLVDLAEELIRRTEAADPGCMEGELYHVQSFMDVLAEWTASNGNSLSGFLEHWEGIDPKIASPADPNAVRITTIHKSKGLEFGYVIIPYADKVELYQSRMTDGWCVPEIEGTDFPPEAGGVYKTALSASSSDTLFAGAYQKERRLQYIDNINVLYVAFTRAAKGLHVIASLPEPSGKKDIQAAFSACALSPSESDSAGYAPEWDYRNMAEILYGYLCINRERFAVSSDEDCAVRFERGEMFDFLAERMNTDRKTEDEDIVTGYPSFPLNPGIAEGEGDVRQRGRLKFSADSVDFFSGHMSARRKGTVLHDILSDVRVADDLEPAVRAHVMSGDVPAGMEKEYSSFLAGRIESVSNLGWFSADNTLVANEADIIDTDGSLYRPDRVVERDGRTVIIDYKFGGEKNVYLRQIGKYAGLYRAMGRENVEAYLWYVDENRVVKA